MGIKLKSIWTQWEFSSDTVRPQGHKSLYPSSCSRLEALFCIPFKDNQAFGASSNSLKAEFIFVCYWREKVDSALSKNSVWSCGPWTKLTSLTFIYQFATQPNQFIAVDEPTSWSCFFFSARVSGKIICWPFSAPSLTCLNIQSSEWMFMLIKWCTGGK